MTALNRMTVQHLDPRVAVPTYDRGALTPGIVHLGVGAFHRSHEAMYLDRLFDKAIAMDWAIHGVGLQPSNAAMRDALSIQDNLYTLVLRHNDGAWEPRVIGSIVDYTLRADDPGKVIGALADPRTRIVSLTVTEGGYSIDALSGRFDPGNPLIAADIRGDGPPTTMFGLVTAALARRRAAGVPAFTVVSCDNIQGNGHVARDTFTAFARLRDPDLADWIDGEVRFPNSMVDRITPQTTDVDRAELARRFTLEDRWPVVCEPFVQWVLEDDFVSGRPPLEQVGVQLVGDVEPYELMKLRLLNASHQAIAYPAYLAGLRLVHEAARDALFADYLLSYMTREAIPTLRPVPGIDLPDYAGELVRRFANPEVGDTLARLCANTSDLIPKFLLPVIHANLAAARPIVRSVAVVAFWARYAQGVDEHGETYAIDDVLGARLRAAAARQHDVPTAFLDDNRSLFGDLVDNERFVNLFLALSGSISERGIRTTLATLDEFERGASALDASPV